MIYTLILVSSIHGAAYGYLPMMHDFHSKEACERAGKKAIQFIEDMSRDYSTFTTPQRSLDYSARYSCEPASRSDVKK